MSGHMFSDFEWRTFIKSRTDSNDHLLGNTYIERIGSYLDDKNICAKDAAADVPRAVEYMKAFTLWKLTK